jgi:hypothetical protein
MSTSSSPKSSPRSFIFPIDFPVILSNSKLQELQERKMELIEGVLPDRVQPNDYIRYFVNRDQKLIDRKCSILAIEDDRTACQVKYYKGDDTKSWRLNLALGDRVKVFIQSEKKTKPAEITMPFDTQIRLLNSFATSCLKKKVEISVDELSNFIGSPITYIFIDADRPRLTSVKKVTAKIEDVLIEEGALVLYHSKAEKKYRIYFTNPKYKFFVDKSLTL